MQQEGLMMLKATTGERHSDAIMNVVLGARVLMNRDGFRSASLMNDKSGRMKGRCVGNRWQRRSMATTIPQMPITNSQNSSSAALLQKAFRLNLILGLPKLQQDTIRKKNYAPFLLFLKYVDDPLTISNIKYNKDKNNIISEIKSQLNKH